MLISKLFSGEYLIGVIVATMLWSDIDVIMRTAANLNYVSMTTAPVHPPIGSTPTYVIKTLFGNAYDPSNVLCESFLTIPTWDRYASVEGI